MEAHRIPRGLPGRLSVALCLFRLLALDALSAFRYGFRRPWPLSVFSDPESLGRGGTPPGAAGSGSAALALVMLFFRPTALPSLLWFLAAPLASLAIGWRKAGPAGWLTPAFLGLALCVLLAAAWLVPNLGELGLAEPESWLAMVARRFQEGVVVRDRPGTYHAPPQGYAAALLLTLDKLYHYFIFLRSEFSLAHQVLNTMFFIPAYLLALAALLPLPGRPRVSLAAFLALAWIIIYAVFQAAQYLDYDWRYRIPVLAPLVVLAGLGAARLFGGRGPDAPAPKAGRVSMLLKQTSTSPAEPHSLVVILGVIGRHGRRPWRSGLAADIEPVDARHKGFHLFEVQSGFSVHC